MVSNLYIAFTEAQLIHIKNIIINENDFNNIIVTRHDVDEELRKYTTNIFTLKGSLFAIKKDWIRVSDELNKHSKVNLYIAHSFNVFTQGLQHTLMKTNKLNSLNIFPDGNLLFNNFSITRFNTSHFVKKIISLFLFSKYKFFKGSIISPFTEVDTVYSYLPGVSCQHRKLKLIKMATLPPKTIMNKKAILILGHKNQKVINANKLLNVVLKNNKIQHLYYKTHPRLNVSDDLFYKELKKHYKNDIELINNTSPIEALINSFPISDVFAVASSSLVTLKILLPQVNVNYYGVEEYLGKHYDPLLKSQFNCLGLNEWL
jgi:hypothetical protein